MSQKFQEVVPKFKENKDLSNRKNHKLTKSDIEQYLQKKNRLATSRLSLAPLQIYEVEKPMYPLTSRDKKPVLIDENKKVKTTENSKSPKQKRNTSLPLLNVTIKQPKVRKPIKSLIDDDELPEGTMRFKNNEVVKKDSARKIVEMRSYFKNIKTEGDRDKYIEKNDPFQKRAIEVRRRISTLKESIAEFYVGQKNVRTLK